MTKAQALQSFWNKFVTAYDQNTVPEDAKFPRITYESATDSFGQSILLTASIWDRSTSWATIEGLSSQISNEIGCGGTTIPYEDGMLWIKRGTPFSQRMGDEDDSIRRIVINIEADYLSVN